MSEPFDPCGEAERLRAARRALVSGQQETMVRFGDEEVRYARADLAGLEREIAQLEAQCAAQAGVSAPRTRFAKRIRFI